MERRGSTDRDSTGGGDRLNSGATRETRAQQLQSSQLGAQSPASLSSSHSSKQEELAAGTMSRAKPIASSSTTSQRPIALVEYILTLPKASPRPFMYPYCVYKPNNTHQAWQRSHARRCR